MTSAGTVQPGGRLIRMRSGLSLDQIFPIRNDASARLMRLKADCLFQAGIIDAEERLVVYARTGAALVTAHAAAVLTRAPRHGQAHPASLIH